MMLPIDVECAPFREKYLDETPMLAPWIVCGHSLDDTRVFISDGTYDVFMGVTREQAERLIVARDVFCKVIRDELALK